MFLCLVGLSAEVVPACGRVCLGFMRTYVRCTPSSIAIRRSRSWTAHRFRTSSCLRRRRSATGAMALTDHNSVSGSMEFAVSARALGLRPIHGAEIDLTDGRHLTLLVIDGRGWSNLCRGPYASAHAHTREGRPGGAGDGSLSAARGGFGERRGSRLPQRLRAARSPRRGALELRQLLDAFGPDRLRVDVAASVPGRRSRARNRRLALLARRLGVRCVATGNVHRAHPRPGTAAGRVRGGAHPHDVGFVGAVAARQLQPRAGSARGDGAAVRRVSRGRRRDRRAGGAAALRPRQRPRLPLPGRRGRAGDAQADGAV